MGCKERFIVLSARVGIDELVVCKIEKYNFVVVEIVVWVRNRLKGAHLR